MKSNKIRALIVILIVGGVMGTVILTNQDHMVQDIDRLKKNPEIEVLSSNLPAREVQVRTKKDGKESTMVYDPTARTFKVKKPADAAK